MNPVLLAAILASSSRVVPVLPQQAAIVARWSASDIVGLNNGDNVTTWADSVNGIVAANASGTAKYTTNVMGGKPSVRFSAATNDFLDIATPGALKTALDSQIFTVQITFQQRANTANTYGTLFCYTATTDGTVAEYIADNHRLHRYPMINAAASIPFEALNTLTSFGNTSEKAAANTTHPLERAFVNGGCVYSNTTAAPGGTTSAFRIGSRATTSFLVNADIFEIVVWNIALYPSEVKQYHAWACEKYAQATPWASLAYFPVFHGDSITNGTGIVTPASDFATWKAAATLGLGLGQYDNLGIGFITLPQMTARYAEDVHAIKAVINKPLKVFAHEWYNHRAASPTPYNNALAYISAVKTVGDGLAFGTSTSNPVDDAVGPPSWRDTYNTQLAGGYGSADALVAIDADAQIGARGATVTYPANFQSDHLHLTAAGATYLGALMSSGISAIP